MTIFFSPHPDDAVLSCGGIIANTVAEKEDVIVCTVMAGDPEPGLSKSELVQKVHGESALTKKLMATRRKEDVLACNQLGARIEQLDIPDAIYRHDDSGEFLYLNDTRGIDKSIYGSVAAFDLITTLEIMNTTITTVFASSGSITRAYAPLALEGHVDHVLTRMAVERWAKAAKVPVVYYEDYPYCRYLKTVPQDSVKGMYSVATPIDVAKKMASMECYQTSFSTMFGAPGEASMLEQAFLFQALCNNSETVWQEH
jgi:LmbE family N-acetylglucosaminyl deacetylase